MTEISNDTEFRNALESLAYVQQRELAGQFVNHVIDLCTDERIARVLKVTADKASTTDELSAALKSAKAATFDCHTRCGSEGDWKEQAGYFVARAASAAVTPEDQCKVGGPAWQSAMSCRMARTSMSIDAGEVTPGNESEQQYRLLSDYLNSQ